MAFHLKNLKMQKDKFFLSLTSQQLCDIVKDGEIMNYINTITDRTDEIGNIFASIGAACDPSQQIQSSVRQKKLAPLVTQLSKIIKEYELKKVQVAAKMAEQQRKQKEAENLAAIAQQNANRKAAENRQRNANAKIAKDAANAAALAANAQLRNAQAATITAVENVSTQITPFENSSLTKELQTLQTNFKNFERRLNQAVQNSRNASRKNTGSAARRGGRRATRKGSCKS